MPVKLPSSETVGQIRYGNPAGVMTNIAEGRVHNGTEWITFFTTGVKVDGYAILLDNMKSGSDAYQNTELQVQVNYLVGGDSVYILVMRITLSAAGAIRMAMFLRSGGPNGAQTVSAFQTGPWNTPGPDLTILTGGTDVKNYGGRGFTAGELTSTLLMNLKGIEIYNPNDAGSTPITFMFDGTGSSNGYLPVTNICYPSPTIPGFFGLLVSSYDKLTSNVNMGNWVESGGTTTIQVSTTAPLPAVGTGYAYNNSGGSKTFYNEFAITNGSYLHTLLSSGVLGINMTARVGRKNITSSTAFYFFIQYKIGSGSWVTVFSKTYPYPGMVANTWYYLNRGRFDTREMIGRIPAAATHIRVEVYIPPHGILNDVQLYVMAHPSDGIIFPVCPIYGAAQDNRDIFHNFLKTESNWTAARLPADAGYNNFFYTEGDGVVPVGVPAVKQRTGVRPIKVKFLEK